MTDIANTARPRLLAAPGHGLAVGPPAQLAAYLHALEARVAALEAHLPASPVMTPADAAEYARVAVETILRAIRCGDLPAAGYVGRSPRLSRDAVDGWLAETSSPAPPVPRERHRRCGRKASEAVEAAWRELG